VFRLSGRSSFAVVLAIFLSPSHGQQKEIKKEETHRKFTPQCLVIKLNRAETKIGFCFLNEQHVKKEN
jgi:hypothetical protein